MRRLCAVAGLVAALLAPHRAGADNSFAHFIQTAPAALIPLASVDYIPLVRGATTYRLPATAFLTSLAPIDNLRVLGNVSGISAVPIGLTPTQLTTLINPFTDLLSGAATASGGGTTNFLRADGAWAAPAGVGTVTSVGLSAPASSLFGVSGSPVTSSGTMNLTTTGTSGGIPYFFDTATLKTSGALAAHAFVIGGGGGAAPTSIALTGLVKGNGASAPSAYAGTSCTNQFPRSLDLDGVATCATVANTDLASSSITVAGQAIALGGSAAIACANLSDDGTACVANTGASGHALGFLDGDNTYSGTQTFGPVNGSIGNGGSPVSGTTYTFLAADCGKTVVFTSGSAVTATIPAAIVPAATVCAFAVLQAGTAKVSVNGTAVAPATLISENSFTGTNGVAGNMIGLTLLTLSAATNAYLTGAGS